MEMSVKAPAAREQDKAKAPASTAKPHGANASDLDIWLQKVEALGELKRITA